MVALWYYFRLPHHVKQLFISDLVRYVFLVRQIEDVCGVAHALQNPLQQLCLVSATRDEFPRPNVLHITYSVMTADGQCDV